MIRTILASTITPVSVNYFSQPPPAAAEPAAPAPAAVPDGGNADLMDFTAPDIGEIGDILQGKKEGDLPSPGKTPAKKPDEPAPKPGAKPAPAAKPDVKGEPPAKQLRDELEAVKKERDELKQKFEAGDPRITDAENAVKEKEKEISDLRSKTSEYERKLAMGDPAVTKELREKDGAYDTVAGKFYASVPELPRELVHSLVVEYDKLPFNSAGYREARAAFEAKVNEALGATDGNDHRKLERALDFIEKTHEYAAERPQLVKKIEGSAIKLQAEARTADYQKSRDFVKAQLEAAKTVPDDLAKTNPFHPKVVIDTFIKALDPDKAAAYDKGIPEFIELVHAGLKPRGEEDYTGMSPEQVKESKEREGQAYEFARTHSIEVMYQGLRALRILPDLVKDWQRLNAKVKEGAQGAPPDPTRPSPDSSSGDSDLSSFKAPDLANMTF